MMRRLIMVEERLAQEGDGSLVMPRVTMRREFPDVRCDRCEHWTTTDAIVRGRICSRVVGGSDFETTRIEVDASFGGPSVCFATTADFGCVLFERSKESGA